MKEHLPFQAQWTVKLLQWVLQKNINLEELITDDDVISGVVSYFTKKVAVDEAPEGAEKELSEEEKKALETLEQELDFVKCRLAGADQQRENETKKLDDRNAELRQQIVSLTQKIKQGEKEIFESKFSVGKMKAALKQAEEETRDYKRTLERKNEALTEMKKKIEHLNEDMAVAKDKMGQAEAALAKSIESLRVKFEMEKSEWEKERSKLLFMLSERDNALSEAREGQAAATREIHSMQNTLDQKESRLTLLEKEAVKSGVPMIKVGDEPVVGSTVAEAMRQHQLDKKDEEDQESGESWTKRSRKKNYNKSPEPASSIELGNRARGVDFSSDTRPSELSDIEIVDPVYGSDDPRFDAETIDYVGTAFNVESTTAEPQASENSASPTTTQEPQPKGVKRPSPRKRAAKTTSVQKPAEGKKNAGEGKRAKAAAVTADKSASPKVEGAPASAPKAAPKKAAKAAPKAAPKKAAKAAPKAAPEKSAKAAPKAAPEKSAKAAPKAAPKKAATAPRTKSKTSPATPSRRASKTAAPEVKAAATPETTTPDPKAAPAPSKSSAPKASPAPKTTGKPAKKSAPKPKRSTPRTASSPEKAPTPGPKREGTGSAKKGTAKGGGNAKRAPKKSPARGPKQEAAEKPKSS